MKPSDFISQWKRRLLYKKDSQQEKLVAIGAHTYVDESCSIVPSSSPIVIGRYCSIAPNVTLINKSHHLKSLSTCFIHKRLLNLDPATKDFLDRRSICDTGAIHIGNDVWIGCNSVILGGVTIGDGSVVGANSVVTKDIKPYGVYAGLPARQISQRFGEDIVNVLRESKWWNYEPEELVEALGQFLYQDLSILSPYQLMDILSRVEQTASRKSN